VNPERFDALAKSLGSSTSRRGILKIALAAAAGGLLSGRFGRAQAQSSGRTSVGLTNTSGGPVDVYVTVKGTALDGCVGDVTKIPNWNLVATGSDNLRGKVTLANGQSLPAYDGGSTCFAATISFGSPPLNCPTADFPCATNLAEFNVNGKGNDDLDISEVSGANAKIQYSLSGGSWWDGFNPVPNNTFGTDGTLVRSAPLDAPGVYPWGCDNCIVRCQPGQDFCSQNGHPNNMQGPCNAKANCDVVPPGGGHAGGTVTITYLGASVCNPPAAQCGKQNNPCCGGTGGTGGTCEGTLICNPGGICQSDVGTCPGKTCQAEPTCVTCGSAGTKCCAPPNTKDTPRQCETCGINGSPCCPQSQAVNPCTNGNVCGSDKMCHPCGAGGQPCCTPNNSCSDPTKFICQSGTCNVCGAGGQPCCANNTCASASFVCQSGMCLACGAVGQPCCAGNACPQSGTCNSSGQCAVSATAGSGAVPSAGAGGAANVTCGTTGQPCCANNACTIGQSVCVAGACVACGGRNQPCCDGNLCTSGLPCNNGKCGDPTAASCGGIGQPCCIPGNTCDSSANVCVGGLCTPRTLGTGPNSAPDWIFPNMHN
jgi:hypothetical protein